MVTLFISDLHLDPSRPKMTRLFLDFLDHQAIHAEALYILGDFFETWIGDDDRSEFNEQIANALRKVTAAGVPVYIMHGNRDFLLGPEFMRRTGCQWLPDPTVIDLYGQPTLLMHGDTLCIDDHAYLRLRKKVRNRIHQKIYLHLPLSIRKAIARFLRNLSYRQAAKNNFNFIDANLDEIKCLMMTHQADLLIHGHTHRPSIHYFKIKEKELRRVVLSDWDTAGNVFVYSQDGQCRLINFYQKAADYSF